MLWNEQIPIYTTEDENGKQTDVKLIAGSIAGVSSPTPAPDSWAASPENEVAIWIIKIQADAEWTLPAVAMATKRTLYFYRGTTLEADGQEIKAQHSFEINTDKETTLKSGNTDAYLLLLQGKPINEPVVQYGPFVMNTEAEIHKAFADYRATEFGGWPWERDDMVYAREKGRFAKYKDGSIETP